MILPIYVYGEPVLRKNAEDIDEKEILAPDFQQLIADMFETMYHANGVGLAAPQIGKAIRLFVIDAEPFRESYPNENLRKGTFLRSPYLTSIPRLLPSYCR